MGRKKLTKKISKWTIFGGGALLLLFIVILAEVKLSRLVLGGLGEGFSTKVYATGANSEPELIAELSGPEKIRREPANWEEIPINLSNAVVAIEDNHFYQH